MLAHGDGVGPVAFLLVQIGELANHLLALLALLVEHLQQHFLGPVEQAAGEIVLGQLQLNLLLGGAGQLALLEKVGVNQGGAVELAALAEQARHAEVRFQGLVVDLQAVEQGLHRLVRLFVEQEIQAGHVPWDSESMRRRWRRLPSRRPRKKPVAMAKKNSGISQSGSLMNGVRTGHAILSGRGR